MDMNKGECPRCDKDMTIRPGAVFTCDNMICPYWRLGLSVPKEKEEDDRSN